MPPAGVHIFLIFVGVYTTVIVLPAGVLPAGVHIFLMFVGVYTTVIESRPQEIDCRCVCLFQSPVFQEIRRKWVKNN